MVNYTFDKERFIPAELLEHIEDIDAYDWTALYLAYITERVEQDEAMMDVNGDVSVELAARFMSAVMPLTKIMAKYPVIILDPVVENLIVDTVPSLKDIKVPYPGFFVNKKFPVKDGYIMGMGVADMNQFIRQTFLEDGYDKETVNLLMEEMKKDPVVNGELPEISFMYVYVGEKSASIVLSGSDEIYEKESEVDQEVYEIMKQAMFFAANISSLITTHVDRENPSNPKKNVRIVPHYQAADNSKNLDERDNRFQIIRVFGPLKDYTKEYNKVKRKYIGKNQESVLVRGHFRHLQSERFKAKRGSTIWIPPFIKGMSKEMHQRIIKLME